MALRRYSLDCDFHRRLSLPIELNKVNMEQAQEEITEIEKSEAHAHPSDAQYIKVAAFLAVLTGIEVFTYFESVHNLGDTAIYIVLTVLMVLKFFYVAAWFMHLKFDSPLMRRVFIMSISFALVVYLGMLTSFRIWT